jgi:hypothetical protein
MEFIGLTQAKKTEPKPGYVYTYFRFPVENMKKKLIGKVFAIYKISESYVLVDVEAESKTGFLPALQSGNIPCGIQYINPDPKMVENPRQVYMGEKLTCRGRAYGLVGYDTAFTRRRSPVRIRLGP